MVKKRITIVGSGVAGLAAACRLQALGHQVTVFEANAYPGGKLTQFKLGGYRFDAGPSLFTMPDFLDDVFLAAGKNPRHYYTFRKIDSTCHYFFADGTHLNGYGHVEKFAKEVENVWGVPRQTVLAYLQSSRHTYDTAGTIFLQNSLHRASTWLTRDVAKALLRIPSLGIFTTLHRLNQKRLGDPRLVQLFDRYATYNGSDPYQAPGVLSSVPHLEFNVGTFLPVGGMHAITLSLYQLACDLGVTFRFSTPVKEIQVAGGRAIGVVADNSQQPADAVVSNIDVYHTYRKLLPAQRAPEKTLAQERSSSALIFYWGIRRQFPQLDLHNILFSADYRAEFEGLFKTHTVIPDPTVYVNITSKYEPADAPEGCENWFVMINVPANTGQDWDQLVVTCRSYIVKKINRALGTQIEHLIECETVLDPRSIEVNTSSFQGSLYGTSSNSKFAAFLRHPNFSSRIKNLYFCGGSVHPGGGIPLALNSGKIVSNLIQTKGLSGGLT